VNLTKIYCKNFCKCHNVPLVQQLYNKKKIKYSTQNRAGGVAQGVGPELKYHKKEEEKEEFVVKQPWSNCGLVVV
jgi:ribosomal protein L44E